MCEAHFIELVHKPLQKDEPHFERPLRLDFRFRKVVSLFLHFGYHDLDRQVVFIFLESEVINIKFLQQIEPQYLVGILDFLLLETPHDELRRNQLD